MADIDDLMEHPKEQLFEFLEDVRFVMLGSPDQTQHMQPMMPLVDKDAQVVWFFTHKSSDLLSALATSSSNVVHMCVTEKDYQACVRGELTETFDQAVVDRFWNPVIGAWFSGGKKDPALALLKFAPLHAAIWASDKNPVTFAYEIAKANLNDELPDIGARNSTGF